MISTQLRSIILAIILLYGILFISTDVFAKPANALNNPITIANASVARPYETFVYYFPFIATVCQGPIPPLPPVDWDTRLGPGGLPLLENVRIIPSNAGSCQKFWRVIIVKFEDINQSGNDHSIYVRVIDENGARVTGKQAHFWGEGSGDLGFPEEKLEGDLCNCNFAYSMFGDGYSVHIEDVIPSDTVAGMIMPMRRHVNYRITFQRVTNP